MAFQSKVHPSSFPPLLETPPLEYQISFSPPYEDVNLANLFNNVQIFENDRIYVPSDPFSDPFIPFGSLSYLKTNNIFNSPTFQEKAIDNEESSLRNPPNSPEFDFNAIVTTLFDPLNLTIFNESLILQNSTDTETSQSTLLSLNLKSVWPATNKTIQPFQQTKIDPRLTFLSRNLSWILFWPNYLSQQKERKDPLVSHSQTGTNWTKLLNKPN